MKSKKPAGAPAAISAPGSPGEPPVLLPSGLAVEMWAIDRPIPYVRNARKLSGRALDVITSSLKEFGFRQPIVVDGEGVIVAGHTRLMGAKKLGMTEVPVHVASNLTPGQCAAYRIMDNRSSQETSWDFDLLAPELLDLKALDIDLSLTGLELSEIDGLLVKAESTSEGLTDPDATPEAPATPVTLPGDLWLLGNHRVLCGDSTLVDAVERLVGARLADMVFTDPPYNIAYKGGTKERTAIENDAMGGDDFLVFLKDVFTNAIASSKPGASAYICHADTERVNFTRAFVESGFHFSSVLIWVKNNSTFGRQDYFWKHEPILYGWNAAGPHSWCGDHKQDTVWLFDRPVRSDLHPTMKPIDLIERALVNSSETGHAVLDLFGGSGSTLIACEKTARVARLMELDPKYVDVIVTRWQQFTGKQATHEESGRAFDDLAAERLGTTLRVPDAA